MLGRGIGQRLSGAALSLITVALLMACAEGGPTDGAENDDDLGHPPAAMVATWTYQSVTLNGSPASLGTILEWAPGAVQASMFVQANGAFVYDEVNANGGQLWAVTGWIYVDEEGPYIDVHPLTDSNGSLSPSEYRLIYTLVGNTLTLERNQGGATAVFTLTK